MSSPSGAGVEPPTAGVEQTPCQHFRNGPDAPFCQPATVRLLAPLRQTAYQPAPTPALTNYTAVFLFSFPRLTVPPMGWSSWYGFTNNIDESMLRGMGDAMASSGLREAGYQHIVSHSLFPREISKPPSHCYSPCWDHTRHSLTPFGTACAWLRPPRGPLLSRGRPTCCREHHR